MFIGTWVDGLILFGHRPGRAGRIRTMPVIDGKRVAAFMTYAVHAGKALDRFARVLDERGATVVASTAAPPRPARGGRRRLRRGIARHRARLTCGAPAPHHPHDWGSHRAILDPTNDPVGNGARARAGGRRRRARAR